MKKIYNARDEIEANMLESYLESAGIAAYSQESGSGEYLKISGGFSVFGRDVFVDDADEEEARKIVDAVIENENVEDDSFDYQSAKLPWYKNKVIIARILIGWVLLSGAAVIIISYLS